MTLEEFFALPSMLATRSLQEFAHAVRARGIANPHVENSHDYLVNTLGFRSASIEQSVDHCYYGCSVTYGIGVAVEDRWTNLVDTAHNTTSNNFAQSGASVAVIADMFVATSACITMKSAFIVLPDLMRCLMPIQYADGSIAYQQLLASQADRANRLFLSPNDQRTASAFKHYFSLPDHYYIDQYKQTVAMIALIAELRSIDLHVYTWVPEDLDLLRSVIPGAGLFAVDDLGSDHAHPGARSHRTFANSIGIT